MTAPRKGRLTEAEFDVIIGRCKRTKSKVRMAMRAHLVDGETIHAACRKHDVDRSNVYAKLKSIGMA